MLPGGSQNCHAQHAAWHQQQHDSCSSSAPQGPAVDDMARSAAQTLFGDLLAAMAFVNCA
jgi:hypothetical protein